MIKIEIFFQLSLLIRLNEDPFPLKGKLDSGSKSEKYITLKETLPTEFRSEEPSFVSLTASSLC